ncbi:MAG: ATP--guanido phosphotransferase [Proteobacteria bacterium]|nr:ATP--guanido phosphotransferase [Pseudomonadota bacterium]
MTQPPADTPSSESETLQGPPHTEEETVRETDAPPEATSDGLPTLRVRRVSAGCSTPRDAVRSLDLDWIRGSGPLDHIVISSRVRIARNLGGHRFPSVATPEELRSVFDRVAAIVEGSPWFNDFFTIDMAALSPIELHTLVEKHLVSPLQASLVGQGGPARGVVLGPRGVLGVMINEEDHLRLQCLLPGLNTELAWETVSALDDALEAHLDFAYTERLGYVTACPSNIGTGLRASVMLHLPALALVNALETIKAQIVGQVGLAVRGMYGEGTGVQGNLIQISNQISLGPREEDLAAKVRGIAERIVEQEQNARQKLRREFPVPLGDKVWRALGILRHAQVVSANEALELLSMVRLGVELEVLPPISRARLNDLLVSIRPATLQVLMGEVSDTVQADMMRARRIRQELKEET